MKEELYGLANHIASAKGGLPQEWQDWAEEIEADIRKLANREAQPVAATPIYQIWDDDGWCDTSEQIWRETYDDFRKEQYRIVYTAPPAPAVSDDTRRMDWLVAHHVTVRKPLRYGSEAMFTAQTITDEEDDYHATKLREQIDAAMLAAAPEGGNDHDTRR